MARNVKAIIAVVDAPMSVVRTYFSMTALYPLPSRSAARAVTSPPMPATWNHPKLGRFKYDGDRWTANVDAPALDAFKYGADEGDDDDDDDDDPSPKGKHELGFEIGRASCRE